MAGAQHPSALAVGAEFETLATSCRAALKTPGSRPEASLYPQFDAFMTEVVGLLRPGRPAGFTSQVATQDIGVPDWRVDAHGQLLGWVELKAVQGKSLDSLTGHDARQVATFRDGFSNLILTNGWDWRLYREGQEVRRALLGSQEIFDVNGLPFSASPTAVEDLIDLFQTFLDAPAIRFRSASDAVRALATRGKAIRTVLEDLGQQEAGPHLTSFMSDMQQLLFKNGQRFGWERFVDSYVQLAVFGTLLWRIDSGKEVSLNRSVGVDFQLHPLLNSCLQIMWAPQSRPTDLEPLLEELCATVNLVDPHLFERHSNAGKYIADPIVEAYEPFFATYDRASREESGVFYTPAQVVEQIVAGVGHLLKSDLGRDEGLLDPTIRYLDPATGTGTFLLGLANAVAVEAKAVGLPEDQAVLDVMTTQTAAFELFPGPYTIAHQRLDVALRVSHGAATSQALPIYLCDTLAAPETGTLPSSGFGQAGGAILDERRRSDEVKTQDDILVILGNPPYERVDETKAGPLEDFARRLIALIADATPPEQKANLKSTKDLYVAFWAWALWALQDPGRRQASARQPDVEPRNCSGIVAYITNRTWILGPSLSGLRRLVRQGASDIYVLDLGGDTRGSHGAKSFAGGDANVFNIRTGVAIVWAVFAERAMDSPRVHYHRLYGTKAAKLSVLGDQFEPSKFAEVSGSDTDPFLPVAWGVPAMAASPSLASLFTDPPALGIQSARDTKEYAPIGTTPEEVYSEFSVAEGKGQKTRKTGRLAAWAKLKADDRTRAWATAQTRRSNVAPPDPKALNKAKVRRFCYRPLDYRYVYDDQKWIDWYRPEMHQVFADGPVPTIVTIERDHGAGPCAIVVDGLMDQHAFNNRGSRGVFHLSQLLTPHDVIDERAAVDGRRSGFSTIALDWLDAIGKTGSHLAAFDYIVGLLHAPMYSESFWQAVEVDPLRVPLTCDADLFDRVARVGAAVRLSWLGAADRPAGLAWGGATPTTPKGEGRWQSTPLGEASWHDRELRFGNGRVLEGVPEAAWTFEVSGYPVLPRWFKARRHWPVTTTAAREALNVVSAACSLVELGDHANQALDEVLASPLHTMQEHQ